jgi:hypothetical protein
VVSEPKDDLPKNDLQRAELEQRAQALLQASAEQLDGATRSRLTQARHAALDAIKARQSKGWFWLLPATGAAAAAVVAVLLMNHPQEVSLPGEQVAINTPVDEMEIVTAEDSLEFYRDVEFYAWLDTVIDEVAAAPESEA